MIIDTHLHERTFSGDSRMNLLELVSEARRKGLDGICITDHDQMGLTQYAAKIITVFLIIRLRLGPINTHPFAYLSFFASQVYHHFKIQLYIAGA